MADQHLQQLALRVLYRHAAPADPRRGTLPTEPTAALAPLPPRKGRISNASAVVRAIRPAFKRCYKEAMDRVGGFGMRLKLVALVEADGHVSKISRGAPPDANPAFIKCLMVTVGNGVFAPPEGGRATVTIPFTFVEDMPGAAETPHP